MLGLGNVGGLIADLLRDRGFDVQGVDADPSKAVDERVDVTDSAALADLFARVDAVVSCLPYHLNARVAEVANAAGVHYLDLTEDVSTSHLLRRLADTSRTVLMPHCGLAPGFICVVGASLAARLDAVQRIELRVGALPRTPNNALGYAFNWSPAGVVNEYLNDCEQLHDGVRVIVPALEELEPIIIEGTQYEAFTTSGGLGTHVRDVRGPRRSPRLQVDSVSGPPRPDALFVA